MERWGEQKSLDPRDDGGGAHCKGEMEEKGTGMEVKARLSFLSVLGGGGEWGKPPVRQGQVILASPPLPSGTTPQLPPVIGTE